MRLSAGFGRETDEYRRSGDSKTDKDWNFHHVENRTESDRGGKLKCNCGDRQRRHRDSKGREPEMMRTSAIEQSTSQMPGRDPHKCGRPRIT